MLSDEAIALLGSRRRGMGMRSHFHSKRRAAGARPAAAVGALALGSLAFGAFAVGAVAIYRLAIRRLAIGESRIGSLKIGNLEVGRLSAAEIVVSRSLELPPGMALGGPELDKVSDKSPQGKGGTS